MYKIVLLRHGESQWNKENRFTGWADVDLTEQGIFFPQIVVIDGLPFKQGVRKTLAELKMLAREQGFPVWYAITVEPENTAGLHDLPESLKDVYDLFDLLIALEPSKGMINITVIKGEADRDAPVLVLDPSTLLIKNLE